MLILNEKKIKKINPAERPWICLLVITYDIDYSNFETETRTQLWPVKSKPWTDSIFKGQIFRNVFFLCFQFFQKNRTKTIQPNVS